MQGTKCKYGSNKTAVIEDVVKPLFSLFYKDFTTSTIKLSDRGLVHMATITYVKTLITNQGVT
jgi:hypothetical protein